MKKLIGVAALMAMAGCSSMSELRQEKPYRSFSSTKGVEQAAECVLFAWQNQSLAGVHMTFRCSRYLAAGALLSRKDRLSSSTWFPPTEGQISAFTFSPG